MSKGSGLDGCEVCPGTMFSLPTTWWNMSRGLRKGVKDRILRGDCLLESILQAAEGAGQESPFKYFRYFERETPQGRMKFGVYGKLSREVMSELEMMRRKGAFVT